MKRISLAQLVRLARQLPGATPAKAKQLKEKIVAGYYGRGSIRLSVAELKLHNTFGETIGHSGASDRNRI